MSLQKSLCLRKEFCFGFSGIEGLLVTCWYGWWTREVVTLYGARADRGIGSWADMFGFPQESSKVVEL
jgi:hypothetical protein